MEKIEEPTINKEIILEFLKKVDILSEEERKILIHSINLIENPIFITGNKII